MMDSELTNTTLTTEYTEDDTDTQRSVSPSLPSVNDRLAYLRPSRELLEYYRKKIGEFDGEREDMVKKLDQYKLTYEEQHKIQWEARQREDEISELQKALSDMQVYLFQEREHVLRLYAENDRLKIRELEDRKKIHALLTLSGLTEREVSYFLKEPPAKAVIEQKLPPKLQHLATTRQTSSKGSKAKPMTDEEEKYAKDNHTLMLQVQALQAQIEEQTKLAKEQIDALNDDRRVKQEENDIRRQRDTDKINTLTEKLHKTQDLLYDSTKDFLDMRYEARANERRWMAEKDRYLREMDLLKDKTDYQMGKQDIIHVPIETVEAKQRKDEAYRALEEQLSQSQKIADMYREQVIQLEDALAKIREEGEVGKEIFKERCDKVGKRLELMNARYQDLERRRNLEVEGFKTDIKNLRIKLKDLEKQLYKLTVGMSEEVLDAKRPDDLDMEILRQVRRTAGRSKHIVDNLKNLKAKVYGLENDLKHL